ncbi:MAG: hypothetical protein HC769_15265 [Cyanobacteria bacterium CRU_2_1]|nr:hypothetical protein [Cyanobacteria bacterium CRU_2_1]
MALLQASSLMIVAYAGYGQIAGLSQERQPHSIASLITALITAIITACLLYEGVTIAALSTVEAIVWGETVEGFVAPLERIAQNFNVPGSSMILAVGAIVAMSGILLHLITDLAWVMWTMGQQRDLSSRFARINAAGVPALGVLVVGGAIACVILNGSIATIWSFSAFNFLLYSAVTHLAAFHLTAPERLCPRWLTGISLVVCISLAFCFDWKLWLVWSGLVVIGVIWRGINQWSNQQSE